VQSHGAVALGGPIRDKTTENVTGIPLLYDIPILGNLFKTTDEQLRRTELLVLITPRVVRNQEEARLVTDELHERFSVLKPLEKRLGYYPRRPAPQ
jgi:general secretion pathway protein D